jgi:hypothetical protein
MWHDFFGLSEQSAMRALKQDGLITLSEDEKSAPSLQETWGLSRAAAEVAARGRDGGSRPASSGVSVAELAALRPDPSNIQFVAAAIEEIASGLRREGVGWDRALREAAVKVMLKVTDDRTADWVTRIAHRFWPQIYGDSGSSGTVHG